jgi:hypothetical protein
MSRNHGYKSIFSRRRPLLLPRFPSLLSLLLLAHGVLKLYPEIHIQPLGAALCLPRDDLFLLFVTNGDGLWPGFVMDRVEIVVCRSNNEAVFLIYRVKWILGFGIDKMNTKGRMLIQVHKVFKLYENWELTL